MVTKQYPNVDFSNPTCHRASCYVAFLMVLLGSGDAALHAAGVRFDVLPVVAAEPLEQPSFQSLKRVRVPLKVSTLIDVDKRTTMSQLYVEARFSDNQTTVLDYCPKTELASDIEGPIEVSVSDEKTRSFGASVSGIYAGISGQGGADLGNKKTDSKKFRRLPEQQAITASGTLNRGSAAYFKFRAAANHPLEGDKFITLDIEVPADWRAGTVELLISAEGLVAPSLGIGGAQRSTINEQRFLVGVYLDGDIGARHACWAMADAEMRLRREALEHAAKIEDRSWPTLFHQLGARLDIVSPEIPANWLQRSLFEQVDPHFDTQIRSLPVDVRVAVLDFLDSKRQIAAMSGQSMSVADHLESTEVAALN